jgi:hypothetical protein
MATRLSAPKPAADAAIDTMLTKTTLSSALPAIAAALRAVLAEVRRARN